MADSQELRIEHGFGSAFEGPAPAPPPDIPSIHDPESVLARAEMQSVLEFVRALGKAVKAARMYPANNPMCLRAVAELCERVTQAFQEHTVIRLVVGQTRLYFQGETVYDSGDSEESLSRIFFRDGIREICFHLGLERDELGRFLEMVREALSRETSEDLVTQLWDETLPHITYVAIDDMLDSDLSDAPVPEEFGSDFMNYVDFELDYTEAEDDPESAPAHPEATAAAAEMHRRLIESGDKEILRISPGEEEQIAAEIADENPAAMVLRVIDTFFEVIDQDPDPASRGTFFAVLENALVSLVSQRQFAAARHILTHARNMAARRADLARTHDQALGVLFRIASDAARLETVADALERAPGHLLDEVEGYLAMLQPSALPALCEILGRVESRRGRKVLLNVLAVLGRGQTEVLLPYLKDDRWFLVRNILSLLGHMKDPASVKHIKPLVRHADLRVRREALAALGQIGEGEAYDSLLSLLRDPDPRMRVSAAKSLGLLGKRAVNPLLQIVLGRDFEARPFEEKRGFYEALGRTNAPDLLPYLKMLIEKKPVFRKKEAEEMRVCAVEALARMRGSAVKALLDEASRDPSSLVRAAVTGAQKRQQDEEPEDD